MKSNGITAKEAAVRLAKLGACDEACMWLMRQKGSWQKAWDTCPHGDWMLWLLKCYGILNTKQVQLRGVVNEVCFAFVQIARDGCYDRHTDDWPETEFCRLRADLIREAFPDAPKV